MNSNFTNFGNLCYFHSLLQAFRFVLPRGKHYGSNIDVLLQYLDTNRDRRLSPEDTTHIMKYVPQKVYELLLHGEQQDIFELFSLWITNEPVLDNLFRASMRNVEIVDHKPHGDLPPYMAQSAVLTMGQDTELLEKGETLFLEYNHGEKITREEWHCGDMLAVYVKRFSQWNRVAQKLQYAIEEDLGIAGKYKLAAVIRHKGATIARGHYVVDVYDNQLAYTYDDMTTQISIRTIEKNEKRRDSVLLFYKAS